MPRWNVCLIPLLLGGGCSTPGFGPLPLDCTPRPLVTQVRLAQRLAAEGDSGQALQLARKIARDRVRFCRIHGDSSSWKSRRRYNQANERLLKRLERGPLELAPTLIELPDPR